VFCHVQYLSFCYLHFLLHSTSYTEEDFLYFYSCQRSQFAGVWPLTVTHSCQVTPFALLCVADATSEDELRTVNFRTYCCKKHNDLVTWHTWSKRLLWSKGSVLAFGTQVCGFTPGRIRRIFRAKKILSTPSFGGEVKP
jgi:hypothetical protein